MLDVVELSAPKAKLRSFADRSGRPMPVAAVRVKAGEGEQHKTLASFGFWSGKRKKPPNPKEQHQECLIVRISLP